MTERRSCPVCLEECNFNSVVLPCKHQYHSECLKSQINNNINKCAECSREYNFSKNGDAILITYISDKFIEDVREYLNYFVITILFIGSIGFILFIFMVLLVLPIYYIFLVIINSDRQNDRTELVGTGKAGLIIDLMLLLGYFLILKSGNVLEFLNTLISQRSLERLKDIENQI